MSLQRVGINAGLWSLLMLACAGPRAAGQSVIQDNIVVVLDASGSMSQTMSGASFDRMTAAKAALSKVLLDVPDTTNVGLLVFSSNNIPAEEDWVYPLARVDRAALAAAIQRPTPGGNTPLGAYLKKGADRLLEQRRLQRGYGTYRLLVVTDGEASDPHLVDQYLPDILSRGMTVDVIGVDMRQDHVLATRVHSYRRANDPKSLVQAVTSVFAEIGSTQDDRRSQEDFEIAAAIPEGMAEKLLSALANSGNQPIGQRPALPGGDAAAGASPRLPGWQPPPAQPESSWSVLGTCCTVVTVVGIALIALAVAGLAKLGKGRFRP